MESIVLGHGVHIPYTSVPETRGNGGKLRDMNVLVRGKMEVLCEATDTYAS